MTWTLATPAAETRDLATDGPGPTVEGAAISPEAGPYEVRRLRIR